MNMNNEPARKFSALTALAIIILQTAALLLMDLGDWRTAAVVGLMDVVGYLYSGTVIRRNVVGPDTWRNETGRATLPD